MKRLQDSEIVQTILYIMKMIVKSDTTSFHLITERKICKKNKAFIEKIIMMDWRDRPSAQQLLDYEWFKEAEEYTAFALSATGPLYHHDWVGERLDTFLTAEGTLILVS